MTNKTRNKVFVAVLVTLSLLVGVFVIYPVVSREREQARQEQSDKQWAEQFFGAAE